MAFLASYRPICARRGGREAVAREAIAPFVDGSCRREPDFESRFPSITALGARGLVPRLAHGDTVAYVTTKGRHGGVEVEHWRLVAFLRVLHRFESHADAARWYRAQGIALPRNCMVEGNPPLPLARTTGARARDGGDGFSRLERWDAACRARAERVGIFLVTEPLLVELGSPAVLTEDDLRLVGAPTPCAHDAPTIGEAALARLFDRALRRGPGLAA